MKLSVTFTFFAVTVMSSCATASVVDNHHENAIVSHQNALSCTDAQCDDDYAPVCGFDDKTYPNACIFQATNCHTNVTMAYLGPCRDKFVDNERVHSSASATSSSGKTPLLRDRTQSANEERGVPLPKNQAIPLIPKGTIEYSLQRSVINSAINDAQLLSASVHPYNYLEALHDKNATLYWQVYGFLNFWYKWLHTRSVHTVDEAANMQTVLANIDRIAQMRLAQLPPSIYSKYLSYANLFNNHSVKKVITEI
ncbi:RxLR-like protein [Plasmopara halstedii]|uniref:RxLR-like protein n=1 Tax=Plasmopara halstedii TaxID=4781 RepID=A0A0N7L635_PLAHL|nr:RxLR-like protein [Plasmopara halstedii]CEG43171.1 RxLR-like protein [Plasmopara halstedii]|eukprot:XP_024579540.1 RxLR-like protein [Plasmopara halstedii]